MVSCTESQFLKGTYIIIIQKQGIISVYLKALILTLLYHIYWEMKIGEPSNIKKHLFYRINCHQIQVIIQILFKNRIYVKNQIPFKNLILFKNHIYVKSQIPFRNPIPFKNLILFKIKR
jgi:hypothetical protein